MDAPHVTCAAPTRSGPAVRWRGVRTARVSTRLDSGSGPAARAHASRVGLVLALHEADAGAARGGSRPSTSTAPFLLRYVCGEMRPLRRAGEHVGWERALRVQQAARRDGVGDTFVVTDERNRVAVRVTQSAGGGEARALERYAEQAAVPVLGHRRDGGFVTCRFSWAWKRKAVTGSALSVAIDLPKVTPMDDCRLAPRGSVELSGLRWRISWPKPRHVADRARHDRSRTVSTSGEAMYGRAIRPSGRSA